MLVTERRTFDCEAIMAYTLTTDVWPRVGFSRRPFNDDDPLAAMRGIIIGTLISVFGFWLPLAFVLAG